ncbi:hypothetical protein GQ600_11808 [Phytophthora cactorum]|nr:hypothetical protein GQ600_11808 [Phytophthora cactorum]
MFAARTIDEGEEITIKYGNEFLGRE